MRYSGVHTYVHLNKWIVIIFFSQMPDRIYIFTTTHAQHATRRCFLQHAETQRQLTLTAVPSIMHANREAITLPRTTTRTGKTRSPLPHTSENLFSFFGRLAPGNKTSNVFIIYTAPAGLLHLSPQKQTTQHASLSVHSQHPTTQLDTTFL